MIDKEEMVASVVGAQSKNAELRREKSYAVPDACQQYIKLRVKSRNEFVPAILGNFSRNGILFECPVPFSKGDHSEAILSISLVLHR